MKQSLYIALGFACSYAGIKLGVTFASLQHEVWANYLLFIMPVFGFLSLLTTLYYKNRLVSGTDLLQDVKICLKTTSLFALFVAIYSYVHYKWIDPTYFIKKNEIMSPGKEMPEIVEVLFNVPFRLATLDLVVLIGFGFMSSFIFAALNKKFVNRN